MTTIVPYAHVTSGAQPRFRRSVRAVEKINAHTRFDGEHEERRAPQSRICSPCRQRDACQSGTVEDGSFWDGPPLKAEFAAQVLGQAMVNEKPAVSAGAAYRKSGFVLLPLFDRSV